MVYLSTFNLLNLRKNGSLFPFLAFGLLSASNFNSFCFCFSRSSKAVIFSFFLNSKAKLYIFSLAHYFNQIIIVGIVKYLTIFKIRLILNEFFKVGISLSLSTLCLNCSNNILKMLFFILFCLTILSWILGISVFALFTSFSKSGYFLCSIMKCGFIL